MHSNSGNIKIASYSDANNVFHESFEPLFTNLLYYKYLRVNIIRGGSCIDSPGCIKKRKVIKKSEKGRHFQCASTLALNYEENDSNPERVSCDTGFINKYN